MPSKGGKTELQIAQYLVRNRSAPDLADWTGLSLVQVNKLLKKGIEGYDVFPGPKDLHEDVTYVAVPATGLPGLKVLDRSWRWQREESGQPYGVVNFPDSLDFAKIQIIPLDGILYGDPAHDSVRFSSVIKKILTEPNTFAFFNGDAIAGIQGGSKADREQLLLTRAAEFQKQMSSVAHKILWAQRGCLEAKSLRDQGFDPLEYFCERLGIPYFTEPVYVDMFWKGNMFTLWAMHGYSVAQLKGAKMNSLRKPAQLHNHTHFIVGGHVGDAMWNRTVKICRDPLVGRLVPKEEFHVIVGNFRKYLGTSSARRGYAPASTDTLMLCLYPDGQHHVKSDNGRMV